MQTSVRPTESVRPLWRRLLGSPADWRLTRPRLRPPRPGLHWTGPLLVFLTSVISWPAFAGATGEDASVAFGLWIGSVSIVLMAWSFLLAVRIKWLEPFFGGLDRMYRVHRWAGSLAIVAMWLHTRAEPEIEGGIRGAGKGIADFATSLAGQGETLLYILIFFSLVRLIPYRIWRLTHKVIGIPFIFACWHFFTAEKPYANGSSWGWWFGAFMVGGIAAWVYRVLGRDVARPGIAYRVAQVHRSGTSTEMALEPAGPQVLRHQAGQWAVVKIQVAGLREPHPFSIASAPQEGQLRFVIRDLGDWTRRLQDADLMGAEVFVEGPYGRFRPRHPGRPAVWVAGGVGITPFLSSLHEAEEPVHLFYAVRSADDAPGLEELKRAEREGRLHLHLFSSLDGNRMSEESLAEVFGPGGLAGHHVALCGPTSLVHTMATAARALGATHIEEEDFDIRQGFGPEVSRELEDAVAARLGDGRRDP